jgi:uncharacterized protein YndB with AHSA1/START domain
MIVKEIYIDAPAPLVYSFLTEPAKVVQWIGLDADVNPRPGGLFRLPMVGSDVMRGNFVEVVPNSKVTFTWGFEGEGHALPAGSTLVEITLKPEGTGTRLKLVHREVPPDWAPAHDAGWGYCLARLELVVRGGHAPPFDPPRGPNAETVS